MPAPQTIIGGRYALEHLLGAGGMGEVWRARHTSLKSLFAVKLLKNAQASDETARARFLTEAQITAQLRSRHAVQVYDFGITEQGQPYLVMEMLDGETLEHRVERGPLNARHAAHILRQAARALDRAHTLGIVHRDFKPANILLCRDEEGAQIAKVVDFGIAKLLVQLDPVPEPGRAEPVDGGRFGSFTNTNVCLGTPQYMAPEQIEVRQDMGPPVDIWALGVVAYECLTGRPPFDAESMSALFERIMKGQYVPATALTAGLPPGFDRWFAVACAHEPAARFATAGLAVQELSAVFGLDGEGQGAADEGARPRLEPRSVVASGNPTLAAPPASEPRLPFDGALSNQNRFSLTFEPAPGDAGVIELDDVSRVSSPSSTPHPARFFASSLPTPRPSLSSLSSLSSQSSLPAARFPSSASGSLPAARSPSAASGSLPVAAPAPASSPPALTEVASAPPRSKAPMPETRSAGAALASGRGWVVPAAVIAALFCLLAGGAALHRGARGAGAAVSPLRPPASNAIR